MPRQLSTPGRWRPVQGCLQVYAVFSGTRGLIAGVVPGQPLEALLQGEPIWVAYVFWISLLVGGLVAMAGEITQLTCPIVIEKTSDLKRYLTGQMIEGAGAFLISMNYTAYAIAIILSPAVQDSRSYPYLAIGLGFLGRWLQLFREHRKGID